MHEFLQTLAQINKLTIKHHQFNVNDAELMDVILGEFPVEKLDISRNGNIICFFQSLERQLNLTLCSLDLSGNAFSDIIAEKFKSLSKINDPMWIRLK